jgi:GAF domain-containing protein
VNQADQVGRRLKQGEGVSGQVYQTSRPLRIDDYARWEGRSRALASGGIQTAMAVPLLWQGEPIGTVTLTRTELNRPFTADDEQMAQLFASQAAAAMENTRLLQETQGRVNELYTLNQIGQAIAAQTELRTLFDVVRIEVTRFMGTRNFYVALYEEATNMLELPYSFSNGQIEAIPPFPLGQGLTSVVVQTRQPLLIHSADEAVARGALFSGPPAQSYLGVPLIQRDRVVAVLAVQDLEKPHAYSEADARLLVTAGSQIVLAIQNIRLLEQTRQRVNELSAIAEISNILTTQLDLKAIINSVGDKVRELFGVRDLYIALYDPRTSTLEFPYLVEGGRQTTIPAVPLGEGLSSIVIHNRQPVLINRDAPLRVRELGARMTGVPARSYLGVPIIAGDTVLGIVSIQDSETDGLFSGGESSLLSTIAANMGTAIENIRLFQGTQRSIQDLTIVNNIGQAVIKQTDLTVLARLVTEELMRVFDVPTAYMALYEPGTRLVSLPGMYYLGKSLQVPPFELGEGLTTLVINTGRPVVINADLPRQAADLGARLTREDEQGKAYLGVPVFGDEGPIGVLAVQDHTREGRFGEDDVRLLTTLASQVGLALKNLSLLGQARRRAEQLAAAAEVSHAATSILDPDRLMVRAAELIRERFALYYVAIFLADEHNQWAELRYATGDAGRTLMERRHRLEIGGQSMVGTAVTTRRARIALDVGKEAVRFANPLLPDTHSEMALPLVVGDIAIGALDVQSTQYNAFTEEDVTALQTMADQVAVAIQNARLYLATEQRVHLEQLINRISNRLRRAVDVESIMAVAMGEIQEVLGARRIVAQLGAEQMLRPIRQTGLLRPIEARELESGNGESPGNGSPKEG